ncbi:sensor histidine kinase [Methylolobus aquaticus]
MASRSYGSRAAAAEDTPSQSRRYACPRLQQVRKLRDDAERESGRRWAGILHEVAAQSMQAVQLELKRLRAEQDRAWSPDTLIDDMLIEVNHAIRALRDVSDDLSPPFLERLMIVDAIRVHCGLIASRGAICPRVTAEQDPIRLADDVKVHCFLAVRLALDNALRHARATQIYVVLDTHLRDYLSLRVLDDGVGFDMEHRIQGEQGLGLRMINEHAETVMGYAQVHSRPGLGTVVEIVVPLAHSQTPAELPSCDSQAALQPLRDKRNQALPSQR